MKATIEYRTGGNGNEATEYGYIKVAGREIGFNFNLKYKIGKSVSQAVREAKNFGATVFVSTHPFNRKMRESLNLKLIQSNDAKIWMEV